MRHGKLFNYPPSHILHVLAFFFLHIIFIYVVYIILRSMTKSPNHIVQYRYAIFHSLIVESTFFFLFKFFQIQNYFLIKISVLTPTFYMYWLFFPRIIFLLNIYNFETNDHNILAIYNSIYMFFFVCLIIESTFFLKTCQIQTTS